MKLKNVYSKPIEEIIKESNLVDIKVHNSGDELQSIELKYEISKTERNGKTSWD